MKRLILFTMLLPTLAMANGFDSPNFTGAGLSTLDSLYVIGLSRFGSTATFSGSISQSMSTTSGDVDGTRYNSFTVTQSNNPASAAEVSGAYFAINRSFGGNPTYINNAVEGVARQSGIDSAGSGTIRGGLFRTYTTGYVKTQMGLDVSARTGSNAICRGGTGFFGARIYMAPYFATGFEDSITNFHGLWIYNESTTNKINNGIRINDAGTTGYDTLLNFNGATATLDMVGHAGSGLRDSTGGFTFHNRYVTIDSASLRTIKASSGAAITVNATDTLKGTLGLWAGKFSASRFKSTAGVDSFINLRVSGAGGAMAVSNTSSNGVSSILLYDDTPTLQGDYSTYNTARATVWNRGIMSLGSTNSMYLNPSTNKSLYYLVGAISDSTKIMAKWDSLGNLRVGPGVVSGYFAPAVCRMDVRGTLGAVNSAGAIKAQLDTLSGVTLMTFAKGTRPATPALGQLIIIDGDTTTDSLLVYLGGAWAVIKP